MARPTFLQGFQELREVLWLASKFHGQGFIGNFVHHLRKQLVKNGKVPFNNQILDITGKFEAKSSYNIAARTFSDHVEECVHLRSSVWTGKRPIQAVFISHAQLNSQEEPFECTLSLFHQLLMVECGNERTVTEKGE